MFSRDALGFVLIAVLVGAVLILVTTPCGRWLSDQLTVGLR